jgi:outer membrane lipoprotein SlyB
MLPAHARPAQLALALAIVLTPLAACAPTNTNTTYAANEIGRTADVTYGVIVSMRPVTVQAQNTGIGALGGAAVGATAGSFIGRNDVRANILGAVAGGLVGAVAGNAVEKSVNTGDAVEFIIRQDDGSTVSVVQTNEDGFRPGDRVVLTRGARTHIAHAS